MATTLTFIFVSLLAITTLVRLWLGNRHIQYVQAHRQQVPAAFTQTISLESHQKAADYSSAKTKVTIAETAAQAALLLVLTIGGGLQWIDQIWTQWLPTQEIIRGSLQICSA